MSKPVSSLSGAELDYWTAKAQSFQYVKTQEVSHTNERICVIGAVNTIERYDPSTNWTVLGPLLVKYKIDLWYEGESITSSAWCARPDDGQGYADDDPMKAVCRCIVASKFGDEVPEDG